MRYTCLQDDLNHIIDQMTSSIEPYRAMVNNMDESLHIFIIVASINVSQHLQINETIKKLAETNEK